jgi:D-alanyl-D-alanine carboxypeptidase
VSVTAGNARRQRQHARRRLHALLIVVLGLLVGLGVLLFVFVTGTSKTHPGPGESAVAPRLAVNRAPPAPSYAYKPAPPEERVPFVVRLPLSSGLLFDVRTGAVLWGDQPDRPLPIASLTKMMTALVVMAHSKPTDKVLITRAATDFSGSGIGLLPLGKRVPEIALLYGLLLPSGNDAAIALAQHVSGTRARFIDLMNARAHQMGLHCSHFNSVSGIVDLDNHSCARDLAVMAHAMLKNRLLAKIISSQSSIQPFPISGGKLYLYNNNPLLMTGYRGTDGVKTGFTDAAGHCLVVTVRRGRRWLGLVLLHSADTAAQAENLLNTAFARLGT